MLTHHELNPQEQNSEKSINTTTTFIQENVFEDVVFEMSAMLF